MKTFLKILSLVLSLAIFIPTAKKVAHLLEGIDHEICEGLNLQHYHEQELDCEFEKFVLNKYFDGEPWELKVDTFQFPELRILSSSLILHSTFQLTSSSRGPPVWV